jgi:hypothetical protein
MGQDRQDRGWKGAGMTAIWEVNYENISAWWLVLIILIGVAIVVLVLSLVTVGFDRRITKEGFESNRNALEAGLRREDEQARAAEEARRRAATYAPGDSHTAPAAS